MKKVEPIRDMRLIKKIRLVLRNDSIRNELLFILGINVGLRISDVLKLTFKDIYLSPGIIKDKISLKEKKTGKTKTFYLGKVVKDMVAEYFNEVQPKSMDDFLFKSRQGGNKSISRQQAWYIMNKAGEEIGIVVRDREGKIAKGEIGTHTLRKTFGYHAYKAGTTLTLLMDIFNHSSQAQTLRYIGITEEEKKSVYVNINLG